MDKKNASECPSAEKYCIKQCKHYSIETTKNARKEAGGEKMVWYSNIGRIFLPINGIGPLSSFWCCLFHSFYSTMSSVAILAFLHVLLIWQKILKFLNAQLVVWSKKNRLVKKAASSSYEIMSICNVCVCLYCIQAPKV